MKIVVGATGHARLDTLVEVAEVEGAREASVGAAGDEDPDTGS